MRRGADQGPKVLESVRRSAKVALVGRPNVGKSAVFGALTGTYANVSNYPGTTVEVFRGRSRVGELELEVLDTPGMYSLMSITEEEKVARDMLLLESPDVVVHVVDAKNLELELPMTLQLLEAGFDLVLCLNMMDEAISSGVQPDPEALSRELSAPVVGTVAVKGEGIDRLKEAIARTLEGKEGPDRALLVRYPEPLERALEELERLLSRDYHLSRRAVGVLALQGDPEVLKALSLAEESYQRVIQMKAEVERRLGKEVSYAVAEALRARARELVERVIRASERRKRVLDRLSDLTIRPLTGLPILLLVVYAIYEVVGVLGAQVIVDFTEGYLFEEKINPFLDSLFERLIPYPVIQDLFVHEHGMLTLGLRYSLGLILPLVTVFFLVFALLEDSGYLPRLALLLDRAFKAVGLSGRAVIPMVLGLGCDTMATIVTRTLETRKERIIATLLLSLAIPCSAQLGVIMGVLHSSAKALLIWLSVLVAVFLAVGAASKRLMPGGNPVFFMEIPPLRVPSPRNVLVKTMARVEWYVKEVVPIFLAASLLIWVGNLTGLFQALTGALAYPARWLGLPDEMGRVFLYGFLRRDYGAAGLYDLKEAGVISGNSLLVASVVLTLFLPCMAQLMVNYKERGPRVAAAIALTTLFFSFSVGWTLKSALDWLGVSV